MGKSREHRETDAIRVCSARLGGLVTLPPGYAQAPPVWFGLGFSIRGLADLQPQNTG